jgi:cytochrome c-type biogenesis protein CcmF
VVEKRGALKLWTIILSILTFSLSLMGTFIVRSGVISSVHAFAVDPERGVFILAILAFFTGGALALFAARAPSLKQGGLFAPVSREGSLVLNNLFLSIGCLIVFLGTIWPLVTDAMGAKISVGAPFFNKFFSPFMLPLLIALPIGPFLAWKRGDLSRALGYLRYALYGALAIVAIAYYYGGGARLAPLFVGLGAWVAIGALLEILWRARLFDGASRDEFLRRLRNLPRSNWGVMLGHLGVGLFVIGAVSANVWKEERSSP